MQPDVVAGGQTEAAGDLAREVGQRPPSVIQHIQDLIGARQQSPAGLRQTDFPAQAIEQAYIELLLQPCDSLADRRLCQVQALAGGRKTAGLGNGDKSVEIRQIHFGFLLVIQSMKNMNLSYLNIFHSISPHAKGLLLG
jgi:hypothetical protein